MLKRRRIILYGILRIMVLNNSGIRKPYADRSYLDINLSCR